MNYENPYQLFLIPAFGLGFGATDASKPQPQKDKAWECPFQHIDKFWSHMMDTEI
jgi:hypothetical protein